MSIYIENSFYQNNNIKEKIIKNRIKYIKKEFNCLKHLYLKNIIYKNIFVKEK